MIISDDGLGYLVSYSLSSLKTDRMLALVVVISLLGLALDRALVALRNRLVYWEKLDTYYVSTEPIDDPNDLRARRFVQRGRRACAGADADPLRPRLRRRGAGVADERAARPRAEPGQEVPVEADPLPGKPRALPGVPRGRARRRHRARARRDLRARARRRHESRRQHLPRGRGPAMVQHHLHGQGRGTDQDG